MTEVTLALRIIHDRIATAMADSGRECRNIRLVAVSKTHPPEAILEAYEAGQRDFAENYLQEAVPKIQKLARLEAVWHYIGRIQRNKTRDIATFFDWVHTVDRERIAQRLSDQRREDQPPLNVCLQVRLSADVARPGADPADLAGLATTVDALPRLRLRGLMCMPPLTEDPAAAAGHFEFTRRLYEDLRTAGHDLDTLSMGTTSDYCEGIAAGSTMIRIGTAIFGPRHYD